MPSLSFVCGAHTKTTSASGITSSKRSGYTIRSKNLPRRELLRVDTDHSHAEALRTLGPRWIPMPPVPMTKAVMFSSSTKP